MAITIPMAMTNRAYSKSDSKAFTSFFVVELRGHKYCKASFHGTKAKTEEASVCKAVTPWNLLYRQNAK
jgi:hypothetical protein